MTFVHFTRPDGRLFAVAPSQIVGMREPVKGEMAPGVQTILILAQGYQGVKEPMDVVEAKLP